jgi:H/ACA ribonucleoprotein complex subunit 4
MEEQIIIKRDVHTNPAYGVSPRNRSIEQLFQTGFIALDKPKGQTSAQSVSYVKKLLNVKKAGHTGTLDPGVSGVLPILLNDSVNLAAFLNKDKEYIGVMHVHNHVTENEIRNAFQKFEGKINQLPPVRSAVARRVREKNVYSLNILEIEGQDVLFNSRVEAGTYIRKLVHDIGQELKVGAQMTDLRRTRVGELSENSCFTLHQIAEAMWLFRNENDDRLLRQIVLPIEEALEYFGMKFIWVADSAVNSICSGAQLMEPGMVAFSKGIKEGETVALMTLKDELIGVAKSLYDSDSLSEISRKQVTKTLRVIMKRDVYPKFK